MIPVVDGHESVAEGERVYYLPASCPHCRGMYGVRLVVGVRAPKEVKCPNCLVSSRGWRYHGEPK